MVSGPAFSDETFHWIQSPVECWKSKKAGVSKVASHRYGPSHVASSACRMCWTSRIENIVCAGLININEAVLSLSVVSHLLYKSNLTIPTQLSFEPCFWWLVFLRLLMFSLAKLVGRECKVSFKFWIWIRQEGTVLQNLWCQLFKSSFMFYWNF